MKIRFWLYTQTEPHGEWCWREIDQKEFERQHRVIAWGARQSPLPSWWNGLALMLTIGDATPPPLPAKEAR